MNYKFRVEGLDCANCAQKIEDKLNRQDSIKEASVVFATMTIFVTSDVEESQLIQNIQTIIDQIEEGIIIKSTKKTKTASQEHQKEVCACEHNHEIEHKHCPDGACDTTLKKEKELTGKVTSLSIQGLDCASCAIKVEKRINQLDSIKDAVVNFSTQNLQVQTNTAIKEDELLKILQKAVDSVEDGVKIVPKKTSLVIEKPKLFSIRKNGDLLLGIIILIIAIMLENQSYSFLLFFASYLISGYKVLWKAFKNILRGEIFDENFLMCIATIGAFWIGEYPEAVEVMLFYSVGEIFQSYAVNKTRSSISSLMDIKSEYANVIMQDTVVKKAPEEVDIGDIILVKVGEKVPLDGVVIKGVSTLDTSSLTGESLPRDVQEKDEIIAGVVNLTELIYVQVTKPYEDSTVSKILELMENAASKKAPMEKFITRFAKIYTPTVVVLAVLLAVVPMLIFKDAVFSDWLYRALTFLIVSCPCALVISIPLGLYAGLGKASKIGVLIKGGNYLELLKDVNTVVFDKTGTLTHGRFEVVEINGNDDLLMYGAYGEYLSNHPIGKSIVSSYQQDIDAKRISDFKEIAGQGISVTIDEKVVCLGNQSYIESMGVNVIEPKTIGTIVHITIDGMYAGNIIVADKIKETSIRGIQKLKREGIRNTVMLTGDHRVVANDIASKLSIDTVYSELLPQDKVYQVESLMEDENCKLAFVGDGINDAPVLARANIGIAMGGIGSDAAIEAADMVLMNDDIESIGEAIRVSKKTNSILKQNVTFTLTVKIGVLLLTMFGITNMTMGVFADVGVTLIAILNSMRILK